jgi:hypothetical protein
MPLVDDIHTLRDRAMADLNAAQDYFGHGKIAWFVLRQVIAARPAFVIRNNVTGTATNQPDLVDKAETYVARELTQATFQQFISIFEAFFFDLLRLWLLAYPQHLMGRKVDFKTVLDAPDKDAVTLAVVNKELNEVLYERPADWFAYLNDKVKLGCPTMDEIERIAEAKASRDALVHNRGVAGRAYLLKAGKLARHKEGEQIDILQDYHRQTWELIRKVVADISNAAIAKAA